MYTRQLTAPPSTEIQLICFISLAAKDPHKIQSHVSCHCPANRPPGAHQFFSSSQPRPHGALSSSDIVHLYAFFEPFAPALPIALNQRKRANQSNQVPSLYVFEPNPKHFRTQFMPFTCVILKLEAARWAGLVHRLFLRDLVRLN